MKSNYYSPRIRRDLVSRLHQEKEARGIPMTKLADRLISAALLCSDAVTNDRASSVAEAPMEKSPIPVASKKIRRI